MDRHARSYAELLRLLDLAKDLRDPNPERSAVTQYEHSLQCATRADTAYADAELVCVALVHDLAKPLTEVRHGELMAEMLREYLSPDRYHVLRTHGEFQADRTSAATKYLGASWLADALRLHAWDAASFDPTFHSQPALAFTPRLAALMHVRKEN